MAAISKQNLITQLLHNKIIRLDFNYYFDYLTYY